MGGSEWRWTTRSLVSAARGPRVCDDLSSPRWPGAQIDRFPRSPPRSRSRAAATRPSGWPARSRPAALASRPRWPGPAPPSAAPRDPPGGDPAGRAHPAGRHPGRLGGRVLRWAAGRGWVVVRVTGRILGAPAPAPAPPAGSTSRTRRGRGPAIAHPGRARTGVELNPRYGVWDPVRMLAVPSAEEARCCSRRPCRRADGRHDRRLPAPRPPCPPQRCPRCARDDRAAVLG
ncbi:hypothetical protein HBB16_02965 [Pseudonocardia sp. MCCB 268]|nr:hypothetical protein [Pseudonocardia cytotoxica]